MANRRDLHARKPADEQEALQASCCACQEGNGCGWELMCMASSASGRRGVLQAGCSQRGVLQAGCSQRGVPSRMLCMLLWQ